MKLKLHRPWVVFALFVFLFLLSTAVFADDGDHRDGMAFFQAFTLPRVWVSMIAGVLGFALLLKGWVGKKVRLAGLGVALFLFGVLEGLHLGAISEGMGMHPSPICMLEKPFVFLFAGDKIPVFFFGMIAAIAILQVIGNKLFCGWVCPVGALQELLHKLPVKKFKVPFKVSNSVRIAFFALFLGALLVFKTSIYEYVNAFHFFHWDWYWMSMLILGVVAIASLFLFRPFCYFICPMGLFSWLLEHVAIFRVHKNDSDCGSCTYCIDHSPCSSVEAIVNKKWSRPDCHACGVCIDLCPNKSLTFRMNKKR